MLTCRTDTSSHGGKDHFQCSICTGDWCLERRRRGTERLVLRPNRIFELLSFLVSLNLMVQKYAMVDIEGVQCSIES
jgi:hypothetical protein